VNKLRRDVSKDAGAMPSKLSFLFQPLYQANNDQGGQSGVMPGAVAVASPNGAGAMPGGESGNSGGTPQDKRTPDELRAELERTSQALAKANKEAQARRERLEQLDAAEAKRIEDARKAAEDSLKEQNKFKELSEQRATDLQDLTAKFKVQGKQVEDYKATNERLTAALTKNVDEQIKALKLDDAITALLSKFDVVEKLDWLTANGTKFRPANGQRPALPATPESTTAPNPQQADEARAAAARQAKRSF
jgi:chromosome segregation ATPase